MLATMVLGIAAYSAIGQALQNQLDDRIRSETDDLLNVYRSDGMGGLAREIAHHENQGGINQMGYILTDSRGKRQAGRIRAVTPRAGWTTIYFIDDSEGADDGRAYTAVLGNGGRLVVIADQEPIEAIGKTLLIQFLIAFGAMLIIGAGGGALLTRVLRRRLEGINRTATAIIGGDLGKRMPLDGSNSEFDRLALTLNQMLERIGDLMENLRQVSGDIAHDMRSPLNRLRQKLEASLAGNVTPKAQHQAVEEALAQADALMELFAALLGISEIEGNRRKSAFRPLSLDVVVVEICEAYQPAVEDAGFSMACDIEPGCCVSGDRHLLGQALTNLLDNCLRHTPSGTAIAIQLMKMGDEIELTVSDDGPGVPEKFQDEMLRRFARMEASRSTTGNGLGLSLVKAVFEAHGAKLVLSDNQPGLRVIVTFACAEIAEKPTDHA